MTLQVNIASDFSEFPFGRYPEHGPYNGARFRDEFLVGPLRRGERITIDLSGARGLAASFLEEAFGGLVRSGLALADIERLLEIVSPVDPSLVDEVWFYIRDAAHVAAH